MSTNRPTDIKLPEVIFERVITENWTGHATIRPRSAHAQQILSVVYTGSRRVAMREVEGDFDNWHYDEVKQLIAILSKFCLDSIQKRNEQ